MKEHQIEQILVYGNEMGIKDYAKFLVVLAKYQNQLKGTKRVKKVTQSTIDDMVTLGHKVGLNVKFDRAKFKFIIYPSV